MKIGHRLERIGDYTLSQFVMFLNAEAELESSARLDTVADLAVVVGSLFASEGESPIGDHVTSLREASVGVKQNGGE